MATAALSLSPWSVSCVAGGRRAVNDHCGTFHQSLRRAVISTSGGLLSLRLRLRRCFARGRFAPLARPLEKLLAILGVVLRREKGGRSSLRFDRSRGSYHDDIHRSPASVRCPSPEPDYT